jgi:Asp-tRNA(Asn)/Glu-tRNA(Gln) amidotransferase A subunit family amidase
VIRLTFAGVVLATLTVHTLTPQSPAVGSARSPLPAFDVMERTIAELQDAMAGGRVTSRQLVDTFFARMEAYDRRGPELNAIMTVNPRAQQIADALDRERAAQGPRGPLHGIPVVVKDNFDTADMPTAGSSLGLAGSAPAADAFQVKKLKAAGAVIIGKTNMHELAAGITTISSLGGQTRNPYDPARNPGGSSGGTGAAVAASFAAFGLGSDTCGSIRIPASHNNLVGLRGTAGLSSRAGIIPLSHTQDIGGPIARTIADLAIALDATVGPDPDDRTTALGDGRRPESFRAALRADALKGARIGVLTAYFGGAGDDPEMADVTRKAIAQMNTLGAETIEVTIPELETLIGASGVINYEFKFDLMDDLARRPDAAVTSLGQILERGLYHAALEQTFRRRNAVEDRDSEAYRRALDARRTLAEVVTSLLAAESLDALAYPTMTRRPAVVGEPQGGSTCQLSAHSGLPAISLPAGFTDEGLPVGIELLGAPWSDAGLLALGYAFEQATHHRRPPLSTPALVNGRPPVPVKFEAQASGAAVTPPVATSASARAVFEFDRVLGRLRFQMTVTGVEAGDLLLGAIHRAGAGENGPLLHRVLDAGVLARSGVLPFSPRDRADLAGGKLYLQIYTRAHPAGALRAQLRLPELRIQN